MSYIGRKPTVGNFQICDAISVVNGQAAYTMQVGSVNVLPETANHMIVSLNGVIQKPNSSYTIAGAVITFSSNLVTGDVINFIQILGDVLNVGTVSDATITNAKTNFVSTSSAAGLQIKGDGTTDGTLQLNCSQNSHGIKIKSPPHSAGASYTLTMPNNDGDANQVLTTNGSGVLSFAAAGGGKINQVLQTDATYDTSSSSAVELFSLAITPSASNSKISIIYSASAQLENNEYCSFDLYRGSLSSGTKIQDGGDSLFVAGSSANIRMYYFSSDLDSPNTTNATTYTVVGVPTNSSNIRFGAAGRSSITLMEVLA